MSEINGMIGAKPAESQPTERVRRSLQKNARPSLLRWAWWTVPLHVVLGLGFWWMLQHEPDRLASVFVGVHVGFPLLLLLTVRWWRDRWGELLALLLINHAVSFAVLLCLPCW